MEDQQLNLNVKWTVVLLRKNNYFGDEKVKNNNILFMLILYVNGLFISQFSLADPIAKDTYFFNVNESKLNFNNQNEKEQKGIIYIKGLFVMSPCSLISDEIDIKEIYIKNIDVIINRCQPYANKKQMERATDKKMFTSSLSFSDRSEVVNLKENRTKHYQNYSVINYIISDEQKRKIIDGKGHILKLKLQYN